MNDAILLWTIVMPLVAGLLMLGLRRSMVRVAEGVALLVMLANLAVFILLFNHDILYNRAWGSFGVECALRLYRFSWFIAFSAACLAFLITLYCRRFLREKAHAGVFYGLMLISVSMVNGAVLADNLILLLFFWEGLLLTMFGMIAIGSRNAFRAATKTFIIVGITDLCMLGGIALTGWTSGTWSLSTLAKNPLPLHGVACTAMLLMVIGAISKGGSMPFHSWIPDAATEAPLPFMAFLPASLEKLLGIYFLTRISMDLFALRPDSWMSPVLMSVGAATILLAVMMALVQKEYKRLLSYHAISQVGYMILGIGTALPVGIIGGLFHMVNNAMYKSCLFLTAGAVEKETGTTDLAKLGGIGTKMPVTFACFLVTAASISGVPPFNGFFSKELVYDAALERNVLFYLAAVLGSFFTAASFLKLGHSVYLGKRDASNENVREAPASMLAPMIVIAAFCVVFGVYNALPLNVLIQPGLGETIAGMNVAGFPVNSFLVGLTVVALCGALLNHLLGATMSGSGLHAADHIRYAPGLVKIYDGAEKKYFDPYDLGMKFAGWVAWAGWGVDKGVNWLSDVLIVKVFYGIGKGVRLAHTGSYALYVLWALAGALAILVFLAKSV